MKIVSDTNIFLAVVLDEPEKDRIIELTSGADVISPEILPYEIGNALSAMVKRNRLTPEQAVSAQASAGLIPVRLVGVDIGQSLRIAMDFNLYAYDAYFLHCAKVLAHPLITLDGRMKQVAAELKIEVLE
jgi:predicted nucleic acid-binding protein